ncbi:MULTISPECIES: hypothetical protein [unclassified Tenacibaculum]|uniref:hypothetical protein n=1 Tax=unclassified Tenacibaculum TaxID=2635139 RepID=UPI001F3DA2C0|nr:MULTISPECIES: hypothetical protein [unclassified Tenacibaculum]MCF2876567.1 hypothetical protein [Tenacibaculum sp. Cn5-1]MCF2936526.1 hypothetical protein [Tenacibaculum sp. Cn5-34]MCG7511881.1 hypothetical protein [Tenacibaculum sp. Cn5-46]
MEELNKWKDMYQKSASNTLNVDELIERLNAVEKDIRKKRILLIVCFLVLIITSLLRLSEFENIYYVFSYVLIVIGMSMKLFVLYKGKYNLISDKTKFNNQSFIKNHISKLKEKINFEKKYLMVFLILMIAGVNFALIGMYDKGTIFNFEFNQINRVFIHLSTILLFFVGFYLNSNKIDRYKNDVLELITELEDATEK